MANEISNQVFPSAASVYPFQQQSAEVFRIPSSHAPPPEVAPTSKEKASLALENVKKMIAEMSDVTKTLDRRLKFEVDLKNHDIIVKVIDPETDKVIRELPPAELEKLHQSIREALGHLINELI